MAGAFAPEPRSDAAAPLLAERRPSVVLPLPLPFEGRDLTPSPVATPMDVARSAWRTEVCPGAPVRGCWGRRGGSPGGLPTPRNLWPEEADVAQAPPEPQSPICPDAPRRLSLRQRLRDLGGDGEVFPIDLPRPRGPPSAAQPPPTTPTRAARSTEVCPDAPRRRSVSQRLRELDEDAAQEASPRRVPTPRNLWPRSDADVAQPAPEPQSPVCPDAPRHPSLRHDLGGDDGVGQPLALGQPSAAQPPPAASTPTRAARSAWRAEVCPDAPRRRSFSQRYRELDADAEQGASPRHAPSPRNLLPELESAQPEAEEAAALPHLAATPPGVAKTAWRGEVCPGAPRRTGGQRDAAAEECCTLAPRNLLPDMEAEAPKEVEQEAQPDVEAEAPKDVEQEAQMLLPPCGIFRDGAGPLKAKALEGSPGGWSQSTASPLADSPGAYSDASGASLWTSTPAVWRSELAALHEEGPVLEQSARFGFGAARALNMDEHAPTKDLALRRSSCPAAQPLAAYEG